MRNKIRRISPSGLIELQIVFALIERFLVQMIGMPSSIIYVMDVLNICLFTHLIRKKKSTRYAGFMIAYFGIVVVSLIVGLIVSIFQTVTSIQEQTLTFVPKIIAIFLVMMLCGSWMLDTMSGFMTDLWSKFSYYISMG